MKRWIILLILVAILVFGAIFVVGLALQEMTGGSISSFADNSFLTVNLHGHYPEEPPEDIIGTIFQKEILTHRMLRYMFQKAKVDVRVQGLHINLGNLSGMGWTRTKEIRDAILDFRQSGKPVSAYMEFATDQEYYIATAADQIVMPPSGILFVDGFLMQMIFLKDTFDKIGVDWEEIHAGRFKSAPEQFTRREMSAANREVSESILDVFYEELLTAIDEGRGLDREKAVTAIDNGPYFCPETAKDVGLIDQVKYEIELLDEIGLGEDGQYPTTKAKDYLRNLKYGSSGEKIALIYATGTIVSGDSGANSPFGGKVMGSKTITKWLRQASEDHETSAIVLRVDSPGGSGLASDIIWREIQEVRKKKPVVVSMGDAAASGGYYISMGADYIFAQPVTITGSVGTYMMRPVINRLYKKIGVNSQNLNRGKNADMFDPTKRLEGEQREIAEKFIDDFYADFVTKAATDRHMSYEDFEKKARGRVWMGIQAVENGLVDEIGNLNDAVDKAKELAGIDKETAVWLDVFPHKKDLFELLQENKFPFSSINFAEFVPGNIVQALNFCQWPANFQPGEPLAILPFELIVD